MKLSPKHTLAVALLAGSTLSATAIVAPAFAQTSGQASGQGSGQSAAPIIPGQGSAGAGASGSMNSTGNATQAQPSQDMGAAPQSDAPKTQDQAQGSTGSTGSADPTMKTDSQSAGADATKQSDTAEQKSSDSTTKENETATDSTKTDRKATDSAQKADEDKSDNDKAAAERPSNETTGSINITTEQRTEVRNIIVESKVEPVDIDVNVSVGVAVPKTVELHPLPPRIIEIVPAYRGYEYFVLADGRIVIVEPGTYEVVYIVTA